MTQRCQAKDEGYAPPIKCELPLGHDGWHAANVGEHGRHNWSYSRLAILAVTSHNQRFVSDTKS